MVHACRYPVLLWWAEAAEVAFLPFTNVGVVRHAIDGRFHGLRRSVVIAPVLMFSFPCIWSVQGIIRISTDDVL